MSIRETFRAFSTKQKSADDVMRAIMKYDQWQAPAGYAMDALKTNRFERIATWGTGPSTPNNGKLWLFSDDEAANAFINRGWNAGPFATPLKGYDLLKSLPDDLAGVEVNPGSPPQDGWFIQKEGIPLTRIWARAVEVENTLQTGERLAETITAFDAFTIFVMPNGAIVTAVGAAGLKNPGLVFTTPDCADAIVNDFGPAAADMKRSFVSGRQLFGAFDRLGVDGFIFNMRGPGATQVLNLDMCKLVIECIELDAKATQLENEA